MMKRCYGIKERIARARERARGDPFDIAGDRVVLEVLIESSRRVAESLGTEESWSIHQGVVKALKDIGEERSVSC